MFDFILSMPTRLQWWLMRDFALATQQSTSWGLRALLMAQSYFGEGEEGGNNEGPFLDMIRDGGPKGAWCAAFLSHCILEGWIDDGPCPVKRNHGARKLFRSVGNAGRFIDKPKIAAIACWARGSNSWQGHVGIVSKIEGERFWAIEGNVGPYPATVTEREVTKRPKLIGFAELP